MILIAESGSTKCNWALIDQKNKILKYDTLGINPFFVSDKFIIDEIKNTELYKYKELVENIFFYGAGCNSKNNKLKIKRSLSKIFSNSNISIKSDLDAACISVSRDKFSINCILGTGSNSCLFDGEKIIQSSSSLGFILGDECSGNYFGKKILSLFFNNQLPKDLREKFISKYNNEINSIIDNIYIHNRPNLYIAKFFVFVEENKNHKIIKEIINSSLELFYKIHISCYKNHKNLEINFVGSVAYFLQKEIIDFFIYKKCKIGSIVKNPITKLIKYHMCSL